jgi:hypothetical protein
MDDHIGDPPMIDETLTAVMLATRDADLGLVPADKAMEPLRRPTACAGDCSRENGRGGFLENVE